AMCASIISSCSKDDDKTTEEVNLEKPVYAEKTVAETKVDMENTGIKMVNELKAMNQDQGVKATVNLLELMNIGTGVNGSIKNSAYFQVMAAVKNISSNNPDANVIFKSLKAETSNSLELEAEFDKIAGVYTYNYTKNDFDFAANASSGQVVFKFPASIASKKAKNNDGKLVISKPKFVTGNFTLVDTKEMPSELKYELSVDGTVVSSFSFTASYTDEGLPSNVEGKLTLGAFELKLTYGYKETEVTVNYSFTHGSTTILDLGGTAGGKFTKAAIDNAQETKTIKDTSSYTYYNYETGQYETIQNIYEYKETETFPERVLYNANAHFQFMDMKIVGQIDFANFMKEYRKIEENKYSAYIDSAVSMINKNMALVVVYASDNKAVAKAEAYAKNEKYDEYNCTWDANTWEYNCSTVQKTRKVIDVQMVFADGSKSSMETYFNQGFDNLITSFNSFIDDLNKTYNWKINHIN
ncbi:MAG TPA: hypothetical protein VIO15_08280, partial [Bacteroidales bacterium]